MRFIIFLLEKIPYLDIFYALNKQAHEPIFPQTQSKTSDFETERTE